MSVFSDNELAYLAEPRLGRLATTGPDGLLTSCRWAGATTRPAPPSISAAATCPDQEVPQHPGQPRGRPGDRRRGPAMAAAGRHGPITVEQLL